MKKKARNLSALLFVLMAGWVSYSITARFGSPFETSRFRIELSETGEAGWIHCEVVDADGAPIEGTTVSTDSNSGWTHPVRTDASGCAVIRPGESDVSGVELNGQKIHTWNYAYWLGHPRCDNGLRIRITVKE